MSKAKAKKVKLSVEISEEAADVLLGVVSYLRGRRNPPNPCGIAEAVEWTVGQAARDLEYLKNPRKKGAGA